MLVGKVAQAGPGGHKAGAEVTQAIEWLKHSEWLKIK